MGTLTISVPIRFKLPAKLEEDANKPAVTISVAIIITTLPTISAVSDLCAAILAIVLVSPMPFFLSAIAPSSIAPIRMISPTLTSPRSLGTGFKAVSR